MLTLPRKAPVLGVPISMTSYDEVLQVIGRRPRDRATVIAVCNVHSVMSARRDSALRAAVEAADIATTDGMPLVWLHRLTAHRDQTRVYGPDLMSAALARGQALGWRHYLYGTTPETLQRLEAAIGRFAPDAVVVGTLAPPFRPLSVEEEDSVVESIRGSRADIVWVGLGMPRQELFAHHVAPRLPGMTLIGVGAAFDLISGTVAQAPPWMQRYGLEWLYRFYREPRRLWRRYLINNPLFLMLALVQVIRSWRAAGGDS